MRSHNDWVVNAAIALCSAAWLAGSPAQDAQAQTSVQEVTTAFEYDGNGNLVSRADGNGSRTLYTYDKVNRLTSIDYPDGAAPDVQFTYDGNGNLTGMTDWTGTTRYSYDVLDRLTRVDDPDGNTVLYGYDQAGNITLVACGRQDVQGYPFKYARFADDNLCAYHLVEYTYDPDNRISSVTDYIAGETTSYAYDRAGNLSRCDLPNGCYTLYGYDADGRLVAVEHRDGSDALIARYDYTLNSIGNRTKVVETTAAGSRTTTYAYDVLDRLRSVSYPDGRTVDYEYDSFGNRTKMTETRGGTTTVTEYSYDVDSRLLSTKVDGVEDERFNYDANGNLVKRVGVRPGDSRQIEYAYDHENRLIRYGDGTNTVTYAYDGVGNRIAKTANGQTTLFINDINRLYTEAIAEIDTSNMPIRLREWGSDLLSVREPRWRSSFYLHDSPAGSVRRLLDGAGQTINTYEYDAFGATTAETETVANAYRFDGEVQEKETGLIFLRARYADPTTGRFLTRDPLLGNLAVPQSLSPYIFVTNSPANYVDPSGTEYRPEPPDYSKHANWLKWPWCVYAWAYVLADAWRHTQMGETLLTYYDPLMGDWRSGWYKGEQHLMIVDEQLKYLRTHNEELRHAPLNQLYRQRLERDLEYAQRVYDDTWRSSLDFSNDDNDDSRRAGGLPPGGGGGGSGSGDSGSPGEIGPLSRSRPGGVDLNRTAEVISEIHDIKGVAYDPATGQLVIYGEKDATLPPMNFDDFVVAARAIFRGYDPVVSIDPPEVPCPTNECNNGLCQTVRYGDPFPDPSTGQMVIQDLSSGTHFGWVMFEADRMLKCLSLGKDNVTCQPVSCNVPGYKSLLTRVREAGGIEGDMTVRFWFQPKAIRVAPSPDGKSMMFTEAGMEVLTETKYTSGGQQTAHPAVEAFAAHFNEHYDEFAAEFPVFEDLRQLAKIVGMVKWIRESDIPFDLSLLEKYAPAHWETPLVTPITSVTMEWTDGLTLYTLTQTGGVTYEGDVQLTPPVAGSENAVTTSRPAETELTWTVNTAETEYVAAAVSLEKQLMDGGFTWTDTDLTARVNGSVPLALTRFYDSFDIEPGPLGWGWHIAPFELQYKGTASEFGAATATQSGYSRVAFVNRAAQSVCDYEPAYFYDRQADVWRLTGVFDMQEDILVYSNRSVNAADALLSDGTDHFVIRLASGLLASFDAAGRLLDLRDPSENQVVYEYDQDGRLTSIRQPTSGRTIALSYGEDGRVVQATGPGGRTVTYSYDASDNLVRVSNGLVASEEAAGHDAGNLIHALQDAIHDGRTVYLYDQEHRLIEIRNGDGQSVSIQEYDAFGRVTSVKQASAAEAFATHYSLAEGTTQTTGPQGYSTVSEYDPNQNLIRWTDARGNATSFTYNRYGNLTAIVDAEGHTTRFYYKQDGYPLAVCWPNGRFDAVNRDQQGRVLQFFQTSVGTGYEENFDQEHMLTAGGPQYSVYNITTFQYDEVGSLIQVVDALGNVSRFAYDSTGNMTEARDARDQPTSYSYDGFSRLIRVVDAEGHAVSFEYDDPDNLTGISASAGSVALAYDTQDRLSSVTYGDSQDGRSYTYGYDAADRLTTVTSPDGTVSSYTYDERGNLIQITHDGVVRVEYEYDDLNRVRQVRHEAGATP
ncbi:MAG: RHS repeat protein [Sedimentisphaerales bacterium]|nr:RHS repeat protein [Sedimentisphaerales bacterium]